MNDAFEQRIRQALATGEEHALQAPSLEGFVSRAAGERLLDVAYATLDSPLGELLVASTPRGLVRVAYLDVTPEGVVLAELAGRVSPRVLRGGSPLEQARRQLDAYLEGRRRSFDLPLDWALTGDFARRVLAVTSRIPFGQVSTYGTVAGQIGSPRAARAAGNALARNPIPIVVPCHRVLRGGGGVGGYAGGSERKRTLLALEGYETGS